MATNIEIEAKVLINENDYLKVKKFTQDKVSSEYIQTNHYIDTDNRDLKKHYSSLRIREIDGKYEMTLKTPIAEGLLEKTESISKAQYEEMKKNNVLPTTKIKTFIQMLGYNINDFKILASLTTDRTDIKVGTYTFSIDKNTYNGLTDYELEREANNFQEAEEYLIGICNELGIAYTRNKVSKQARAMAKLTNKK